MSEETDQLTVNVEADPPGYRPAKKKAAKKALTGKERVPKKSVKRGKPANAPTISSPRISSPKPVKKVPTKKAKVGKSSAAKTSSVAAATPAATGGSKKAGKPAARPGAGGVVTVGARGAKKMGKPPKAGAKTRSGKPLPKPAGSGRTLPKPAGKAPKKSVVKVSKPGKPSVPRSRSSGKSVREASGSPVDTSGLKPDRLYGITRINQPKKGNLGWWLRIGPKGSRHDQFFADKKNGGEAKALKLATAKRNELYAGLPDKLKRRGAIKRKAA